MEETKNILEHFKTVLPMAFELDPQLQAACPICGDILEGQEDTVRILPIPHWTVVENKVHIFGYTHCFFCNKHTQEETFKAYLDSIALVIIEEARKAELIDLEEEIEKQTLNTIKDFDN